MFTKCEALELTAIEVLQEEKKLSFREAVNGAAKYAQEHLWNAHHELEKYKYHPQGHVYLQGKVIKNCTKWRLILSLELDKPDVNCESLLKCTAAVLDGDRLQAIFISTQQNSLELRIEYSTRSEVLGWCSVQDG